MDNKKRLYIQIGVIALCVIGGIVAYLWLSSPDAPPPEVSAADQRQQEVSDAMNQAQPAPAPEIQRTSPRGRIQNPGAK